MRIENKTSTFQDIKRGVRQGCVLLPDLFSLYKRQGVVPSESETDLLQKFLSIVREQQAFRDSQSEDSRSSQSSSQTASQLERHISRQDSRSSSEGTVILDDDDDEEEEEKDDEHQPIISLDSIKKVVSFSQSFTSIASQKDSQDQSVADILASLLEERGPPSSQLSSLEDKDSVLNQSTIRDEEVDNEADEETLLMSQSLCQDDKDEGLAFDPEKFQESWHGMKVDDDNDDIVMDTDEDEDDIDLLPQFDGASDEVAGAKKKVDKAHNMAAETPGQVSFPAENSSQLAPGLQTSDSSQNVNQWVGESSQGHGYPSDQGSGFSHQQQSQSSWSGQATGNWQGQSPMWQQQQRFHNWSPQHQQQAPGYSSQQMPYRAASPFHSPPHNSFASPSHHSPGFQTPSPSIGGHRSQFQYSGYQSQSPSSSQQQYSSQVYQSPYQSPGSSSHSYHQSPQPYQSPASAGSPAYQSPLPYSGKAYAGSGSYQSPGYQSSPSSHSSQMYQSPTTSNPYQSVSSNGGQMYQSPYQSPQQAYPPTYPSPNYHSQQQQQQQQQQPGWSPQRDYPGYFPGHASQHQQQHQQSSLIPGVAQHSQSVAAAQHTITGAGLNYSHGHTSPQVSQPVNSNPNKSVSSPQTSSAAGYVQSSTQMNSSIQQDQKGCTATSQGNTNQNGMEAACQKHNCEILSQSQASKDKSVEFKSPQSFSTYPSGPGNTKLAKEQAKKPSQSQPATYARALPPPSACNKTTLEAMTEKSEAKTNHTSSEKLPQAHPTNKISTLDFKPMTSSSSTAGGISEKVEDKPPVGVDVSATPMIQQLLMEESPVKKNIKPKDREAAAAMRKPMIGLSPPKPKKKSKVKSSAQGLKPPGRPRSSSASSPVPTMMDFRGGFSPQHTPIGNQHQMLGRPGRSHSITLPFGNDPTMVGPTRGYGWNQHPHSQPPQSQQMQWSQSYPTWQQQQQQSWASGQWQNYSSPSPYGNGSGVVCSPDGSSYSPKRVQSRSFSADAAQSPFYTNSLPQQQAAQSDSQQPDQTKCMDKHTDSPWQQQKSAGCETQGNLPGDGKDTSSLSSLLQLVSDVGSSSDDTGWDSVVSGSLSNTQPNGNADILTNKSTPTSESTNQASPSVKDFITLETPAKPNSKAMEKDCGSSEECDQMDENISVGNKNFVKSHPRLGKQNRLKRMGPKLSKALVMNPGERMVPAGASNAGGSRATECNSPNPWYTYTFHVPTPVFKKLKFYQSAHARRQTVKVVRMHPMDARRYSLLKIGLEVVKVGRLTPQDLARYNVVFPPPSQYASPDGSSNRVNLDIPTGSGDSLNGDGSAEEGSCISFDTDFPPNKVAPPSSFDASQAAASVQRSVSQSSSRSSPRANSPGSAVSFGGAPEWGRQYSAQQQQQQQQLGMASYSSGGISPSRASSSPYLGQGQGFRPQIGDFPYSQQAPQSGFPSYPIHQPMPPGTPHGRHMNAGPSGFPPMFGGQKCSENSLASSSTSSIHNNPNYNPNYQTNFMSNSSYSHPHHQQLQHHHHHAQHTSPQQQQYYQQSFQHHHHQQQQQQQQYQLQHQHHPQPYHHQPQTNDNSSHLEQKNELRSPGQHGLVSNIDGECAQGYSGVKRGEHCSNGKPTTGTLPINTWVNARINHADKLAHLSSTVGSRVDFSNAVDTSSHLDFRTSLSDGATDHWQGEIKHGLPESETYLCKKKKFRRRKKRGSLSLKKNVLRSETDGVETVGSVPSDTDKDASCEYYTQLKSSDSGADGDAPTKIVLKNVKSLRLKIPKPYSECVGNDESRDFAVEEKRYPGSDLHEQFPDVPSRTSECLPSDLISGRGMRQGCRQAKLRSIYSSFAHTEPKKKKQKRKKKERLKEGVHYIIIGKFKGYQSMLVKIRRVPVSPGQVVGVDKYEQLSARDIVRQVTLPPFHESTEDQSTDTDIQPADEKPSRSERQGKRRRKFRSAFAQAIFKERRSNEQQQQQSSFPNHSHPKNGEAGLMRVEASANNNTHVLSTSTFFGELREVFLQRTQSLKADHKESPPVTTLVFEGISLWQFADFKKKLVKNLNSNKRDEYSSSSDDEEDILEEEILHQKSHAHESESEESQTTLSLHVSKQADTHSSASCNSHSLEKSVRTSDLIKPSYAKEQNEKCAPIDCYHNNAMKHNGKHLFTNLNDSYTNNQYCVQSLKSEEIASVKSKTLENQHCSATNKAVDVKIDNFLKRQMVYYEDISSTSENESEEKNETTGKGEQLSPKCPPLRLSFGSNGIKILPSVDHEPNKSAARRHFEPETVPISPAATMEDEEDSKDSTSSKLMPVPGEASYSQSETVPNLHTDDISSKKMLLSGSLSQKTALHALDEESEDSAGKIKQSESTAATAGQAEESKKDIGNTGPVEPVSTENSQTFSCEKLHGTSSNNLEDLDAPSKKDASFATGHEAESLDRPVAAKNKLPKRIKRRAKNKKRSVRDQGKVSERRTLLVNKESSSNDEAAEQEDKSSGFEKKRLRQRKQTSYRFYLEDLDSSDDDIWGVKESSLNKDLPLREKKTILTVLDRQDSPKPTKPSSSGGSNSRRKKAPVGGGKLFNSLSLLHMATLANLTEAQQDSLDGNQSTSREATSTPTEQYSDKANGDCSREYTPSLETLSFISPKGSDETGVSPPVAFSPTDKKAQDQARSGGQNHVHRRLFQSVHQRANLKPGCNGSSNLGTRPLHLSHLVNDSASSSPVPSNFTFGDSNQVTDQPAPVSESSGGSNATTATTSTPTSAVHQLLETRKAQVNCASFSMKDILKLATPDDSMDSDSKDCAAVVKPPEVRRAQVRSTSLSMSDILQLTSSTSPVEESSALHRSLLTESGAEKVSHDAETEEEEEDLPEASTSLLSQLALFGQHLPDASRLKPMEDSNLKTKDTSKESQEKQFSSNSNDIEDKQENRNEHYKHLAEGVAQVESDKSVKDQPPNDKQKKFGLKQQEPQVLGSQETDSSGTGCEKTTSISKPCTEDMAKPKVIVPIDNAKEKPVLPQVAYSAERALETGPCFMQPAALVAMNDDNKPYDLSKKCDETDGGIVPPSKHASKHSSDVGEGSERPGSGLKVAATSVIAGTTMCVTQPSFSPLTRLPKISVTCEDQTYAERSEKHGSQISPHWKERVRELNPLHPLQIPSYPYLGWPPIHPYPSAPSSDSPMYRHPYYWQWQAQPSSSTSSPLNLCTSHRSPNNYSPITPTSPMSPYFPSQAPFYPFAHASSLSPPAKKSKPLWYPWLNVESSRNKEPAPSYFNSKSHHYHHHHLPSALSPSTYRHLSHSSQESSSQSRDKLQVSSTPKDSKKVSSINHSIAGLLASSPAKSEPLKVNKEALSSCETVSQFLGTVIDTAYSRSSKTRPTSSCKDSNLEHSPTHTLGTRPNSVPDNRKRSSTFSSSSSTLTHYRNGESVPGVSHYQNSDGIYRLSSTNSKSQRQPSSHEVNEIPKITAGPFSGVRKGEADRVRAMLENEMILRGQLGLPPIKPLSRSAHTSGHSELPSENQSLTERLVSQLIKGTESGKQKEPVDASKGRKRSTAPPNTQRDRAGPSRGSKQAENPSANGGPSSGQGDDGRDERSSGDKHKMEKSPQERTRDMIIRPVSSPPSRKSVEDSLQALGLNSIQPPVAFCSNNQDLPDRPMEHGGRVLKVETNRCNNIETFPCSQHLIGIEGWRERSLSRPGPHTQLLVEAGGVLALKESRQLGTLLTPDTRAVACPARWPPARATVVAWLNSKMAAVRRKSGDGGDEKHQGDRSVAEKSVKFSQHPQLISPTKAEVKNSQTSSPGKHADGSAEITSPICSSDKGADDSSMLMDTDLDISCTPTQTPGPMRTQAMSQEPDSCDNIPQRAKAQSLSPSSPHTLDVHFRRTKRRTLFASPDKIKEAKMAAEPAATVSSTPLRRTSTDLFDPSCTPIALSSLSSPGDAPLAQTSDVSSGRESQKTALLKRVSTNTENQLRRNVLSSQTQRQFSELGFTAAEVSQIEGPTPKNSFGFKVTQNQLQGAKARHKYQHITTLSLELHIETRGDLRPDPELDPIQAVFYSVLDDVPVDKGKRSVTGIILIDTASWASITTRQQTFDPQAAQRPQPASTGDDTSTSKTAAHPHTDLDKNVQRTPPCSPRPVASQSPSPTTKKGGRGKGRGRGGKASAKSPVRTGHPSHGAPTDQALLEKCSISGDVEVTYVKDEMHLLGTLIDLVIRFDPDILVGFEIQMLSWGFLLQRAAHLGLDLCSKIARVQDSKENNQFSAGKDEWGADHMSEIHIIGRVVLNLWRIIRHEVALNVYTFENVAFHILHRRIPLYSFRSLTRWFNHKTHLHRWRVLEHYTVRVKGQLDVIDSLDLIGKTSEFARVFGIEFYDVLARGSQIRVESMMLRLAKPLNFVPVSPSVNQRARQRAPECIPLTLEPESQLYTSPVVVLDFQSLYPSIMIAYNYCFSTCLGRLSCLENAHEGPFEFGCTSLKMTPATLKKIQKYVTVSPNGVVFLKSTVRRGVLPRMVEEILNTRIMVKKSMKSVKDDKTMSRMLDARQLGLKLIANVTYGYTGASFSGRMPCIEVGDSIVRKARESLERAIDLVRSTPRWGAQVVYGDTDSLFIHFPGRSKDEAFTLGHEIADAVTAMFPSPMKLKFEKVYLPCVLQTKKRYVGFMYESPDQKDPVYDAKGIETVRRDSCSAVSKILERSIKVLFSTHDLSRVREYVTRQLHKLLEGKVSVLDLIFAKEFRGSLGYKPGACVPALEIARRRLRVDRRREPRVGERVPYVIVHGPPGLPLIQLVREPHDLTIDPALRLNATYYISKQILPPLDRMFSLIGVNVFKWYQDMPKVVRVSPLMGGAPGAKQGTISQFFATTDCPVCDAQTKKPVCEKCATDPQLVSWTVVTRIRDWERSYRRLKQVCVTCQGTQDAGDQTCVSTDCPVMFRRIIARQDLTRADNLKDALTKYLRF
ncbi:DNA polymerase zeta catalytic subunit-like [Plakobranchus ocellatus]|uniref:DNA polymerase zeta catalytic subunit n=1 Tax=Plakobranchus ocellatus TaxID=259542 RepID=A0AAV4A8B1_9GAST|nr:DNA polymerase zeta catalytic subunit-like [Plakobranchus ocellatus]